MGRVKKITITVASLVFLMISLCQVASASTQASLYLNSYGASIYKGSVDGSVRIDYTVAATQRSDLVGVSHLTIYGTDGTYKKIQGTVANGLLRKDAVIHMSSYTYQGTPGANYSATVTVYAEKDGGSDTRTIATGSVTAPGNP